MTNKRPQSVTFEIKDSSMWHPFQHGFVTYYLASKGEPPVKTEWIHEAAYNRFERNVNAGTFAYRLGSVTFSKVNEDGSQKVLIHTPEDYREKEKEILLPFYETGTFRLRFTLPETGKRRTIQEREGELVRALGAENVKILE